jgi:FtsH-binding integral membrane protein
MVDSNFSKLLSNKKGFIISVYILLAVQLAIMASVISLLRKNPETYIKIQKYFWLWFVITIGIILILGLSNISTHSKLALFTVFSILIGFNCIAASSKVSIDAIKAGFLSASSVFIGMTLVAFLITYMGINLSFMGFALIMALLGLIISMIITLFTGVSSNVYRAIVIVSIVLFSIFVAFDTNTMIQPEYRLDVVNASMNLFLDIINLFTSFVGLELKR